MWSRAEALYASPNALAPHYSRSRVSERLLLTGHSHQAWPDCGFEGQVRAWRDAAEFLDEKWGPAFDRADRVRQGFAVLLGDPGGHYSLSPNTHDLLVRWLSALPLRKRPRLVTTDGEFHTIRRQMIRLEEEGIEVVRVPSAPAETVGARLAASVNERTAAVMTSTVFFNSGHIGSGWSELLAACDRVGAELLLDVYHSLNVVPFSVQEQGLEEAFIVGGGYKYCQLGEGNCFLRIPAGCRLRPVITGWYAEFDALESKSDGSVQYGLHGRFAGATYDPTSHYRAAEVFDFHERLALSPEFLREVSQHQIGVLAEGFDGLDLSPAVATRDRDVPLARIAGFLAITTPKAKALHDGLRERGVLTDYRSDILRFGPAPYLSDCQLRDAMAALGEAASHQH